MSSATMQVRDGLTQVILVFVLSKQYSCSRKLLVNATKFRIENSICTKYEEGVIEFNSKFTCKCD
jgi:hypothetical protein